MIIISPIWANWYSINLIFLIFPAPFGATTFKLEGPVKPKSETIAEPEAYPLIFALFLVWFANFLTWLRKGKDNGMFSDNQSGIGSCGVGFSIGMGLYKVGLWGIILYISLDSISFLNKKTYNFCILL